MPLVLLKPHVVRREGDITTPDIIVDHLFIDFEPAPVNRITHEIWQQVPTDETAPRASYGVMALGGGALILPVLVLASGAVVVARKAWRLNDLDRHIAWVELNELNLGKIGLPGDLIEYAGGSGDEMPRGYFFVQTAKFSHIASLYDPVLARRLEHRVVLERTDFDRWGDGRPLARYSIGPTQKEITHFI